VSVEIADKNDLKKQRHIMMERIACSKLPVMIKHLFSIFPQQY